MFIHNAPKLNTVIAVFLLGSFLVLSCVTGVSTPTDAAETGFAVYQPVNPELNRGRPKSDEIYSLDRVTELSVTVTARDWRRLAGFHDANWRTNRVVPAAITITGIGEEQAFPLIGLGLRGKTSRRRPFGDRGSAWNGTRTVVRHTHFRLDLNNYVAGQKFLGIDRFNIKWPKNDGTRVKEAYGYDLLRRFGVTEAPRAGWAHLTLSVTEDEGRAAEIPLGIFTMVEAVDSDFIQDRVRDGTFSSREGWLFKCQSGANLQLQPFVSRRIGVSSNSSSSGRYIYDLKTPKDDLEGARTALTAFITNLNKLDDTAFQEWIPTVLNVERFLKILAVNAVIGNWDEYWNFSSNYYLYLEKNGQIHFIPYDYDNILGTGLPARKIDPGTRSVINWGNSRTAPLVRRIMRIPGYQERYRQLVLELLDEQNELFHHTASTQRITAWRHLIRPWAQRDAGMNDLTGDPDSPRWSVDRPPEWGLVRPYRILGGTADPNGPQPNFFLVRDHFARLTLSDRFR